VTPPRSILLIRLGALGDILHAVPALGSLRAAFPRARIDWVVEQRHSFLVRAVAGVDSVLTVDTRTVRERPFDRAGWRELGRAVARLRRNRYDIALDLQGLVKTGVLALLSGAKERIGFSRALVKEGPAAMFYHRRVPRPEREVHVARLNLLAAELAGGLPVGLGADLDCPAADADAIDSLLRREQLSSYVVINPGAGWYTKRWSVARFGELAARIQLELGLDVVVTTAPGEEALYREIADACRGRRPRHIQVPFLQLVPLYLRARLFVGGDTGPLHLASALGIPVVGIYGPTSPVRNGPVGERDVAVCHQLHCSFCYGRSCPTANECMDIPVAEVFDAVVARLQRAPAAALSGDRR
jgi:lipopolysaccharide heptosyltransferase I